MKECMEEGKPLVSIVLATYNPRMDWLREQLISLNDQTYNNLELLVLDDCSTSIALADIENCVIECITKFPFEISQNEQNMGSTKTFEKLTLLARGEYIAYCDQDDVWHGDKVERLLAYFKENINLAYSDVKIIDENGNNIANCISELRARHILFEGANLSDRLVVQNFVIGCTSIIKKGIAKASTPFIEDMVHDQYLALIASLNGELALCREPLVSYRVHSDNQTNILTGIQSKEEYFNCKIMKFYKRLLQLENKNLDQLITNFFEIKEWAQSRINYYQGNMKFAVSIWKYRKFNINISLFELIGLRLPNILFVYALRKIKEGKI